MRFLVDENVGPSVARWLSEHGHDVFSVFDEARGWSDDQIIRKAQSDDRIIVTIDKDFGEKVFRDHHIHKGIILLRIEDERYNNKIKILTHLLDNFSDKLAGEFVVSTEKKVRFARIASN